MLTSHVLWNFTQLVSIFTSHFVSLFKLYGLRYFNVEVISLLAHIHTCKLPSTTTVWPAFHWGAPQEQLGLWAQLKAMLHFERVGGRQKTSAIILARFLYSKTFIDGLFYPYFIFCITRRQHVYSPTAMMRRVLHMTEDSGGLLGGINKSNSKEVTSHFQVT